MSNFLVNPYRFAVAEAGDPAFSVDRAAYSAIKLLADGSAWEDIAAFPGGGGDSGAQPTVCGSSAYGLTVGGSSGKDSSYIYDGSADTWGSDIGNSYTFYSGAGGSVGTSPNAPNNSITFAGLDGVTKLTTTAEYTGISWTNVGDLSTGRRSCGGCGNADDALCYGGRKQDDAIIDDVELWDGSTDTWDAGVEDFGIAAVDPIYVGTGSDGIGGMGDG